MDKPDIRSPDAALPDDFEYQLAEPLVNSPAHDVADAALDAARRDMADDVEPVLPPEHPLITGVVGFLGYRDVLPRWIVLSIGTTPLLYCAAWAVGVFSTTTLDLSEMGNYLGGVFIYCLGGTTFGGLWFVALSTHLLAILNGTADGNDRIVRWPDAMWFDWFGDAVYLIIALCISAAPGVGLGWLLSAAGVPMVIPLLLAMVLLFPPLLLSMLESNSAGAPFSVNVWGSMLGHATTWVFFYLESFGLLLGCGVASIVAIIFAGWWALPPVAMLLTGTAFMYFRLLGRLAWCCGSGTLMLHGRPRDD